MGFFTFVGAEWCGSEAHHGAGGQSGAALVHGPPSVLVLASRGRGQADSAASNLTAVIIDVTAAAEPRKLHGGRPSRPLCGAERYPPDHRSGRVPAATPHQVSGQPGHRPASFTHRVTTIDPLTPRRPLVCGRVNGTKDDITSQTWHGEAGCVTTTGNVSLAAGPGQPETNAPALAPAAGCSKREEPPI